MQVTFTINDLLKEINNNPDSIIYSAHTGKPINLKNNSNNSKDNTQPNTDLTNEEQTISIQNNKEEETSFKKEQEQTTSTNKEKNEEQKEEVKSFNQIQQKIVEDLESELKEEDINNLQNYITPNGNIFDLLSILADYQKCQSKADLLVNELIEKFNDPIKKEQMIMEFNKEMEEQIQMLKKDWMPRLKQQLKQAEVRKKIIEEIKYSALLNNVSEMNVSPILLFVLICRLDGEEIEFNTGVETTKMTEEKKNLMEELLTQVQGLTVDSTKNIDPNEIRATELLNNFLKKIEDENEVKEFEDLVNKDFETRLHNEFKKMSESTIENFINNKELQEQTKNQLKISPFLPVATSCKFMPMIDMHYNCFFKK